jgi:mitochondrial fusion and transport protein UGO1
MTACITDAMSTALQPIFHNFLFVFVPVASRGWPMLLIPVASHLITGLLLSPLDLVRTRLIAQSSSAAFRTYTGPTDALSQILRDEGGIRGVYFHPHLLIPAILDNTLRPFIALSLPILLGSRFGVESDTHPFAWCFVEFIAGCAGLLVTLPVETIRRRLQIQARGNAKSMKCCVHTNKTPYTGVLNALWRIASEEGSRSSIQTRRDRQAHAPWPLNTGLPQLYRGLGMGIGAGSIVLFLSIIASGAGGADSGWAEL